MTEYFNSVDEEHNLSRSRSRIIDGLKEYVEDEFNAETSQLNLNAWKLRFDIDVTNREELITIVDSINQLLTEECPHDFELVWDFIPTDSNNNKNGWFSGGAGDDIKEKPIREMDYPIEAFRITVPRKSNK